MSTPTRRRSLVGMVFGRLTVKADSGRRTDGHVVYLCECSCGKADVPVMSSNLQTGNTQSCGCYQADRAREALRKRSGPVPFPAERTPG